MRWQLWEHCRYGLSDITRSLIQPQRQSKVTDLWATQSSWAVLHNEKTPLPSLKTVHDLFSITCYVFFGLTGGQDGGADRWRPRGCDLSSAADAGLWHWSPPHISIWLKELLHVVLVEFCFSGLFSAADFPLGCDDWSAEFVYSHTAGRCEDKAAGSADAVPPRWGNERDGGCSLLFCAITSLLLCFSLLCPAFMCCFFAPSRSFNLWTGSMGGCQPSSQKWVSKHLCGFMLYCWT